MKFLIEDKNIYLLDDEDNRECISERTFLDIIGRELHDIPIKDRSIKMDQNIGYYLGCYKNDSDMNDTLKKMYLSGDEYKEAPTWSDILEKYGGLSITCSCGGYLCTKETIYEHWKMGHFDRDFKAEN